MKIKFCKENEEKFNQAVKNARRKVTEDKTAWEENALANLKFESELRMGDEYREGQEKYEPALKYLDEEREKFCQSDCFTYDFYEKLIDAEKEKYPFLTGIACKGTVMRTDLIQLASKKLLVKIFVTIRFVFDENGDLCFDNEKVYMSLCCNNIRDSKDKENSHLIHIRTYLSMNVRYKEWYYENREYWLQLPVWHPHSLLLPQSFVEIIERSEWDIYDELDSMEEEERKKIKRYIYKIYGIRHNPIITNENGAKLFKREFGL